MLPKLIDNRQEGWREEDIPLIETQCWVDAHELPLYWQWTDLRAEEVAQ